MPITFGCSIENDRQRSVVTPGGSERRAKEEDILEGDRGGIMPIPSIISPRNCSIQEEDDPQQSGTPNWRAGQRIRGVVALRDSVRRATATSAAEYTQPIGTERCLETTSRLRHGTFDACQIGAYRCPDVGEPRCARIGVDCDGFRMGTRRSLTGFAGG